MNIKQLFLMGLLVGTSLTMNMNEAFTFEEDIVQVIDPYVENIDKYLSNAICRIFNKAYNKNGYLFHESNGILFTATGLALSIGGAWSAYKAYQCAHSDSKKEINKKKAITYAAFSAITLLIGGRILHLSYADGGIGDLLQYYRKR